MSARGGCALRFSRWRRQRRQRRWRHMTSMRLWKIGYTNVLPINRKWGSVWCVWAMRPKKVIRLLLATIVSRIAPPSGDNEFEFGEFLRKNNKFQWPCARLLWPLTTHPLRSHHHFCNSYEIHQRRCRIYADCRTAPIYLFIRIVANGIYHILMQNTFKIKIDSPPFPLYTEPLIRAHQCDVPSVPERRI